MALPIPPTLQQLHRLDRSSPDFHDHLCNVLYGEEYVQCVPNLQDDHFVWLVEYLDRASDTLYPSSPAFRKCLRELRSICSARGILPSSYTLSSDILEIGPEPFASGGFCDVYHGTLGGSRACVKRARVYTKDCPEKATKTFCREAAVWRHLKHPNILPFLGITVTPPQLISDWMSGGELRQYIRSNPNADRLRLLSEVANGLHHIHSCNVIHGNIKGPNILVDDSGHARIADFGHAAVAKDEGSMESDSDELGYSPRWTAPEILNGQGTYSKEADIFAFAMVIIEVFTGAVPFASDPSPKAIRAIMEGSRPPRPTHPTFTENLWTLTQRCWDNDPHLRPEVSEVLQVLLAPGLPSWKRLIRNPLFMHERTPLIASIFSDRSGVEVIGHLSGDDAQAFINVMYEPPTTDPQEAFVLFHQQNKGDFRDLECVQKLSTVEGFAPFSKFFEVIQSLKCFKVI